MKRCPECRRDYYDDTLVFCLDDGANLLEGPANDEPKTSIFGSNVTNETPTAILTNFPSETPTKQKFDETAQTKILSSNETGKRIAPVIDEVEKITEKLPNKSSNKVWLGALLAGILAIGGFFGYKYFTPTKQIESIAVMPFVNESKNEDVEYLSDGMTETLINSLSQIPNLNVKARSSVFRYKGKQDDLKKIASELNVQAILTGQVIQRGDQLTLNLELIDPLTDNRIWGNSYQRKSSELVSLQSEIARDVSSKLKSKLSSAETASVEKNYTANSEAYQLYLKGRYHWNKRETKEFEKAVEFFKQAIEKDPNYALAYTGLADTYALFPAYGDFRPKDYLPQAKQAAQKALELDPNLAEAHTSFGQILLYGDYDFPGAEKAYKRAIELDPKYATAHQWYGELLFLSGKQDEAFKALSTALELDPFSMIINREMWKYLLLAKRFDEALLQGKKIKELFPDEVGFHGANGDIYAAQGKFAEAFEEYTLSYKANKEVTPELLQQAMEAYKKGGWDGFVKWDFADRIKFLNEKQSKNKNGYVPANSYAFAYASIKDKDKTIEYLNKAFEERALSMTYLNVEYAWDFVRDDPRFKELVKKVGIPE